MDIVISNKSDKPIYEQIYEQVATQIINGKLLPGIALPSIRNISSETGISIITIKKAWEMLEINGYIYTRSGIGCFVKENINSNLDDLKNNFIIEKIEEIINYSKGLNISKEELVNIIKDLYK